MGWVGWVGLGKGPNFSFWNGLGPAKKLMFLFMCYWFIYYILLTAILNERNHIHRLKMAQATAEQFHFCTASFTYWSVVSSAAVISTSIRIESYFLSK